MRKSFILLTLVCIVASINAQEKRILLKGKTVLNSLTVNDAYVINKNTNISTITNDKGTFEIPIKVGDSLLFSHINSQNKIILITNKIVTDTDFTVVLNEKIYALNEITLEKPKSIFYQDKDIGEYTGPEINAKTLHLPYANTKPKKDNSILKFKSGGVLSLNNLISSLNGNKKRTKLLQKIANEDTELLKIRKQFTDDFFITDLKIKKEYINQFLNDCIDKNIIRIFKSNNSLKLTKLLIRESKLFPHKIVNENLFLTKK